MKRFVGRHILILSLVVPLGASLLLGGSASAAQPSAAGVQPTDATSPVCEVLDVSSQHAVFFTEWSFVARVSSAAETGGTGVWKMLGQRFVLRLHKGQPSVSATFHASTQSTSTKVTPRLVACR